MMFFLLLTGISQPAFCARTGEDTTIPLTRFDVSALFRELLSGLNETEI
jgi:hypothetical protein